MYAPLLAFKLLSELPKRTVVYCPTLNLPEVYLKVSNIYHILDKIPKIEKAEMDLEYESLAMELIKSGRVRIDTDYEFNFTRFSDPSKGINLIFSRDELYKPELLPFTKNILKNLYNSTLEGEALSKKINEIISNLAKQANKLSTPSPETINKLVRLFVTSAHPIVIKWLLLDKAEVFITYSHSIGDMMDVENWQKHGANSGMQSTDGKHAAIFVSCGGNPFAENQPEHRTIGNGWPAVARLQIIAAQELGHFADIKRDSKGRQITRHSANFSTTKPTPHVSAARKQDIVNCSELLSRLLTEGKMQFLLDIERRLKFYDHNKVSNFQTLSLKVMSFFLRHRFLSFAQKNKLFFIKKFASDRYLSLMIIAMIEDMKTNLAPIADVYKRSDKEAEEAIACAEALARVPQQVMKWGHLVTSQTMKGLYKIYYKEVIPSLELAYEEATGVPYKRNFQYQQKASLFSRIKRFLSKTKPTFKPVRDL